MGKKNLALGICKKSIAKHTELSDDPAVIMHLNIFPSSTSSQKQLLQEKQHPDFIYKYNKQSLKVTA